MTTVLVERLDDTLIEIYKSAQEVMQKIAVITQSNPSVPRDQQNIEDEAESFWYDLRRAYHLMEAGSLEIDEQTWQIFGTSDENKGKWQVVSRISDNLIKRWREIQTKRKKLQTILDKVAYLRRVFEAKTRIFSNALLEKYPHLAETSAMVTPELSVVQIGDDPQRPVSPDGCDIINLSDRQRDDKIVH